MRARSREDIQHLVRLHARRAEIPQALSPHELRHACATSEWRTWTTLFDGMPWSSCLKSTDDRTATHHTLAAANAKAAGAAAWTFHQRVGFNLQDESFQYRLGNDEAMRAELLAIPAALEQTTWGINPEDETDFYHLDAVGSVRAITNQDGTEIERHEYFAFGDEWNAPATTLETRRFTGKERDAETGSDYFGARTYLARAGRFSSVDPAMSTDAALTDPQRWNRYIYARDNPGRYIDPNGAEITTPQTFQQQAFTQQVGANLQALTKAAINIVRAIDSPGHMTPEAEARYFEQPESAVEAKRMQFFDLLLTAAPLLGLGGTSGATGMIDSSSVRFSQNSIAASFRGGGSIDELAAGLKSGSINPKSLAPIRLVERDGKLYSLDNRRLYAAQQAGVKIRYRMATPEEILRERYKFTTVNDGISVTVR